jgi:hypothetical protein
VLTRPRVLKAAKMAVKCFLKHGNPFQHDPDIRMPKRINMIKVKCVDQRSRLGYKL